MSDIFESLHGEKLQLERQTCRVAYTINNAQPVACTIIGEQPLFYMDYEGDVFEDEMGLFDDADFAILESELRELKREIDSFDKFSESFASDDEEKIIAFLDDKDIMCAKASGTKVNIEALSKVTQKVIRSYLITLVRGIRNAMSQHQNGRFRTYSHQAKCPASSGPKRFATGSGSCRHPRVSSANLGF